MFKIIEPEYHCFYKTLIDRFMELIKLHHFNLSERDQNRATFILADTKNDGVCGGAFLLKRKLNEFSPELIIALSDFLSPAECVWECTIALSIEKGSLLYQMDGDDRFCQTFYRNLHNRLMLLGKKEGVGFLCISLESGEYLCTEGLISWPYVLELKPQDSSDGLFHGILPLIGSQSETYQQSSFRLKLNTKFG